MYNKAARYIVAAHTVLCCVMSHSVASFDTLQLMPVVRVKVLQLLLIWRDGMCLHWKIAQLRLLAR